MKLSRNQVVLGSSILILSLALVLIPLLINKISKLKAETVYSNLEFKSAKSISEDLIEKLAKCAVAPARGSIGKVSLIQTIEGWSKKMGKTYSYHIAVEVREQNSNYYVQQIIFFNSFGTCSVSYDGLGEDPEPLHAYFDLQHSHSISLAWNSWRLKNIPRERENIQNFLNTPSPVISEEDYWALSKLGFKMPKNYRLMP